MQAVICRFHKIVKERGCPPFLCSRQHSDTLLLICYLYERIFIFNLEYLIIESETKLPYDQVCQSVGRFVCCLSVINKGKEFSLLCFHRSTCIPYKCLLYFARIFRFLVYFEAKRNINIFYIIALIAMIAFLLMILYFLPHF